MTALDLGKTAVLFVTNVLNGIVAHSPDVVDKGTVVRIVLNTQAGHMPGVASIKVVGSDFPERTDPAALVVGPTGVGLASGGTLYVADSVDDQITAIPNALTRHSRDSGEGGIRTPDGLTTEPV